MSLDLDRVLKAMTQGSALHEALKAEGFPLPDECSDVHLTMPVDGIMQLHYTVNLTGERLQQVGRALERIGKGVSNGSC